ncbi:hypothetical protein PILCRDRAFT_92706 [Piloderma croceum F 1598]|uniref:Lon proteolytic domain-containing protein n=1 Tax=Piloderma croceum (strain F 1598) TaxID=765440 RepID=A0A0C3BAA7_PILCF|nr:hypothetical protein PILCRDRAFT_92706 [Piloderma croceum F 1598]
MPEGVRKVFYEELAKLIGLELAASEANVTRNYLEWLTQVLVGGALPGKIIQALKRVGTENPLVLIDEVDKIGRGINGDPASALLEMLDPEQNNGKAALNLILDLGEDIFPEPAPTKPTDAKHTDADTDKAKSVEPYDPPPNEPAAPETSVPKSEENSDRKTDYVGPPIYQKDQIYTHAPPAGVSTGLGYLGNGSGAVMPVEAMSMPGKGGLQLTGKLGEVIRESAQIGLSWVKAHAYELGITQTPEEQFLTDRDIHVHMPEGSIGKEGPNTDQSRYRREILAVHRAGIKTILAPGANRADIEANVPESMKTGIKFVYVLHEVFKGQAVTERWKDTLSL